MEKLLRVLTDGHQVDDSMCDKVLYQFQEFMRGAAMELSEFNKKEDRLDLFFKEKVEKEYPLLWSVISKVLLLSHGQASVERGFSLNKNASTDNQSERSLIARRVVKDNIIACGGVLKVELSKVMMNDMRKSRSRYMAHLEEEKARIASGKKRKENESRVEQHTAKETTDREKDIDSLRKSVKELAYKCEETHNIDYVVQSNSLRRTMETKEEELVQVEKELNELQRLSGQ